MFEGCAGCCITLLLIPLVLCILIGGALVYIYSDTPDAPISDRFKASTAEAQAFEDAINRATIQASREGYFVLTFDERQLSSWMALEGETFADEHNHAFPFKDVQVGIDGGQLTFYAKLNRFRLNLPLEVIIEPAVNNDGKLEMEIIEARVGAVGVPHFVLENVTDQLEERLLESLNNLPGNYFMYSQTLSVGKDTSGLFAVQGNIR
ncbi:MAG: hypothetical protein JW966_13645 [Anaerolineae bacterium]|nr:hypothetical protein [Anaerolineae bacterium]